MKTDIASEQDCKEQVDSLSRRGFLKGVGILAAGGVAGAVIPASAQEAASSASASASASTSASASASAAASSSSSAAVSDAGEIFNGVKMAIGHIVHNPDLCAGCRTCEIVCATYHEGVASSELSRIQWTKDVEGGCTTDIMTCKQCVGPECLAACPTGALHVDDETGARVIDPDVCIGCQSCLNACPATPSRIRFNVEKSICFKCDLCGGDPQCVKYCPTGALTASWITYEDNSDEQSIFTIDIQGDAKPFTHIETSTMSLDDTDTGVAVNGVLWTSHATQFNIVLVKFDVTADFYDASGNLLGSSDADTPCHIEIPEMQSGEIALAWTTDKKAADIGSVTVHVTSEIVTNAPGQEN